MKSTAPLEEATNQLFNERRFVQQQTEELINHVKQLPHDNISLENYVKEVHKLLDTFKNKISAITANKIESCPDGPLLDICFRLDKQSLVRLRRTCKRFHILITNNEERIWRSVCLDTLRFGPFTGIPVKCLELAHSHSGMDWKWFAKSMFAARHSGSFWRLLVELGSTEKTRYSFQDGNMYTGGITQLLNGYGIQMSADFVYLGNFVEGRKKGKGTILVLEPQYTYSGNYPEDGFFPPEVQECQHDKVCTHTLGNDKKWPQIMDFCRDCGVWICQPCLSCHSDHNLGDDQTGLPVQDLYMDNCMCFCNAKKKKNQQPKKKQKKSK